MMGADVRLILPSSGCLHCFGGVANSEEAVAELIRPSRLHPRSREPWWIRRAGSLRTLNMLAVSIGTQLLSELVAERVQESRWVQVQYDERGDLTVETINRHDVLPTERCPLCQKAGMGDDGYFWGS
jgi:hypothetical protein